MTSQPRSYGHIIAFVVAGIALLIAGWDWNQLHSTAVLFMSADQLRFMNGLFSLCILVTVTGAITGLVLLHNNDQSTK